MRLEDRDVTQDREQTDREHEAEIRRVMRESSVAFARAAQAPRPATIVTGGSMFTSEPLEGVQSPFYAGDRYYANEEDARRARIDLVDTAGEDERGFSLTESGRTVLANAQEREANATLRRATLFRLRGKLVVRRDAMAKLLAGDRTWLTITPGELEYVKGQIARIDAALAGAS